MEYHEHKKYFETAYNSGTDFWTHLPFKARGAMLIEKLAPGALILDIGSGRGMFAKQLAEMGFRVIGIDYIKSVVEKANAEIKNWGLEGKLKFLEGDALNMPFVDGHFDAACDFGLLENLYKEDWEKYASEVNRILKPGGYYLNISLSRETQQFFDFRPKGSPTGDFEKFDVHYHFFKNEEMKNIFDHSLTPIVQDIKFTERPEEIALLETLFQKK